MQGRFPFEFSKESFVMNEKTLVAVCGYSGDANQIVNNMSFYTHHGCPVVILSPAIPIAGRIERMGPHICECVGPQAYIGQASLDRQRAHMQTLLKYPYEFFLMNDADSFCLSPEIPRYLYDEPDVLWSNVVSDEMHIRPKYVLPRLAFQPPYFFSRKTLSALLAVADQIRADPITPFIDHYWVQLACAAKWPYKNYRDGISCPSTDDTSARVMRDAVRSQGKIFIHSVKTKKIVDCLTRERKDYLRTHRR